MKEYIIKRKVIQTESKNNKEWDIFAVSGKERVLIARESGRRDFIRPENSKSMLRTKLAWRYGVYYRQNSYHDIFNKFPKKCNSHDSGYYVGNIMDVVRDEMNRLAKETGSPIRFYIPSDF
jgi:hypothetical protein